MQTLAECNAPRDLVDEQRKPMSSCNLGGLRRGPKHGVGMNEDKGRTAILVSTLASRLPRTPAG